MDRRTDDVLEFEAFFDLATGGTGVTGLSPTVDVYNPAGTKVVADGAASETGGGLYGYNYTMSPASAGKWRAVFKTADATVSRKHMAAMLFVGRGVASDYTAARAGYLDRLSTAISSHSAADVLAAFKALLAADVTLADSFFLQIKSMLNATVGSRSSHDAAAVIAALKAVLSADVTLADSWMKQAKDALDAAVSTRLATTGYTAPPTAAANADAIADELLAGHLIAGSAGAAWAAAGSAADPLTNPVPGDYVVGSAGYAIGQTNAKVLAPGVVRAVNPGPTDAGVITFVRGDAYDEDHGNEIHIPIPAAPTLAGASLLFSVDRSDVTAAPTVTGAGDAREAVLELTSAQTEALAEVVGAGVPHQVDRVYWRVVSTWGADSPLKPQTIAEGELRRPVWDAR